VLEITAGETRVGAESFITANDVRERCGPAATDIRIVTELNGWSASAPRICSVFSRNQWEQTEKELRNTHHGVRNRQKHPVWCPGLERVGQSKSWQNESRQSQGVEDNDARHHPLPEMPGLIENPASHAVKRDGELRPENDFHTSHAKGFTGKVSGGGEERAWASRESRQPEGVPAVRSTVSLGASASSRQQEGDKEGQRS
jgi:hypothetical protein